MFSVLALSQAVASELPESKGKCLVVDDQGVRFLQFIGWLFCLNAGGRAKTGPIAPFLFQDKDPTESKPAFIGFSVILYSKNEQIIHGDCEELREKWFSQVREMKVIVGITGASGAVYALNLLKLLSKKNVETCLIISRPAEKIITHELGLSRGDLFKLASEHYEIDDLAAPISSGSQRFEAVVVVPCSMGSLAAIAQGYSNNLLLRVVDVALKERRKVILVPRETPVNAVHLRNMLWLSKLGVIMIPACPGFYHGPKSIEDLVNFIVEKIAMHIGLQEELYEPWKGLSDK